MKTNLSLLDKVIRIILAFTASAFCFTGFFSDYIAILALALAIFFIASGLSGYCPVYKIFRVSTHLNLNDKSYKDHKRFRSV